MGVKWCCKAVRGRQLEGCTQSSIERLRVSLVEGLRWSSVGRLCEMQVGRLSV